MTATEVAFPVGATTQELVDKKGTTYDVSSHTVTRIGEDGAIPILHLFVGDSFGGEILEGGWRKVWDSDFASSDPFVAKLSSGNLLVSGIANIGGTGATGNLQQVSPIVLLDGCIYELQLESPTSDSGAVASRDLAIRAYLHKDAPSDDTILNNNDSHIKIEINIDENGLIVQIYKRVNDSPTLLWEGSDYTGAARDDSADPAFRFKLVFSGKPGTSGATITPYMKQAANLAGLSAASWNQLESGGNVVTFDISDLEFHVAYPHLETNTQNTTYWSAGGNEVKYSEITVKYPQFDVNWDDDTITDDGAVMLFDDDPDSGGVRVYDKEHSFVNDIYVQNGLIRLKIEELVADGLDLSAYFGGVWNHPFDKTFYVNHRESGDNTRWCKLLGIEKNTPEEVKLKVRALNSATDDTDVYHDFYVSIRRGSYIALFEGIGVYPASDIEVTTIIKSGNRHIGYAGDDEIGDTDLSISANNTTLSDNYSVVFDDAGLACLVGRSCNLKPDNGNRVDNGYALYWRDLTYDEADSYVFAIFIIPFPDVAKLFVEAEDATVSASTREYIDAEHDGFTDMSDMVTDAQPDGGEDVQFEDQAGFWTVGYSGVGSIGTVGEVFDNQSTDEFKTGTSSLKFTPGTGANAVWQFEHDYGVGTEKDMSDKNYIGFWFYGSNSGRNIKFFLWTSAGNYYYVTITDNFSGWRWLLYKLVDDFTSAGAPDIASIRKIYYNSSGENDLTGTWYVDHVTLFDGLWSDDADCTVTINDTTDVQEGNYCVKCTLDNTTTNIDWNVTPISPIANTLKFDYLKFYGWANEAGNITLYIQDSAGQTVRKAVALTTSPTLITEEIPHNASEVSSLGWTDSGSFDFTDFAKLAFRINGDAGDWVRIDGLHFYIGTTTTKGRGETLSDGEAVVLDANGEYARYEFTAITDLPEGRYLVATRAKDTDQVADILYTHPYDNNKSSFRGQDNIQETVTLTSSFSYNAVAILDVYSGDDGDTYRAMSNAKNGVTEDTILVDYIVLIPLSNGRDWPMDLAHGALYDINTETPVDIDSLKTDYIGIKQDGAINFH